MDEEIGIGSAGGIAYSPRRQSNTAVAVKTTWAKEFGVSANNADENWR